MSEFRACLKIANDFLNANSASNIHKHKALLLPTYMKKNASCMMENLIKGECVCICVNRALFWEERGSGLNGSGWCFGVMALASGGAGGSVRTSGGTRCSVLGRGFPGELQASGTAPTLGVQADLIRPVCVCPPSSTVITLACCCAFKNSTLLYLKCIRTQR